MNVLKGWDIKPKVRKLPSVVFFGLDGKSKTNGGLEWQQVLKIFPR